MPYRIDLRGDEDTFDRLVAMGALDAERLADGSLAALLPDRVTLEQVVSVLGLDDLHVSPATARDAGSVWVLSPRAVQIGAIRIAPAHAPAEPGTIRLVDSGAFGTGLHPTTALCVESMQELVAAMSPQAMLDVGTGSGVLSLCGLLLGVPRATAIDVDEEALRTAIENARLNGMEERLLFVRATPREMAGTWPLVVANVLASPLMEMAPSLVRRVGTHGHLVLSGISAGVHADVESAYQRLGMRRVRAVVRNAWVALVLRASW